MTSHSVTAESSAGLNLFRPRILHTAYFVADIERSLRFYRKEAPMSLKLYRHSVSTVSRPVSRFTSKERLPVALRQMAMAGKQFETV